MLVNSRSWTHDRSTIEPPLLLKSLCFWFLWDINLVKLWLLIQICLSVSKMRHCSSIYVKIVAYQVTHVTLAAAQCSPLFLRLWKLIASWFCNFRLCPERLSRSDCRDGRSFWSMVDLNALPVGTVELVMSRIWIWFLHFSRKST